MIEFVLDEDQPRTMPGQVETEQHIQFGSLGINGKKMDAGRVNFV